MLSLLFLILVVGLALELVTVTARLILDKKSSAIQAQLKIHRLHHSYLGLILLVFYFLWSREWLLILGGGIVLSDLLHHFVVVPLLVKQQYDLGMPKHSQIHRLIKRYHKPLAIILIALGLLALITPLTPGSWFIPIGLVMLVG